MSKSFRLRSSPALIAKARRFSQRQRRWFALSRSVDWLGVAKIGGLSVGITSLWLWQWQLLVAIALGSGAMAAIYLFETWPWQKYLEEGYRLWHSRHRRLLLAGMGGSLTVLLSYGAIAFWQSMSNHWLTSVMLIQGLMMSAMFALLFSRHWQYQSPQNQFEQALENLGDRSSVRRLYAIRQLRQLLQQQRLTGEQRQTLHTFLQLSWQQEREKPLREALLGTLRLYTRPQVPSPQPLQLQKSRPTLNLTRQQQTRKSLVKEQV